MSVVALQYVQIPQLLGWGRYEVTTTLPRTGGLSHISLVTYRGVEVGKVRKVDLTADGVVGTWQSDGAGLCVDLFPDAPPPAPHALTAELERVRAVLDAM